MMKFCSAHTQLSLNITRPHDDIKKKVPSAKWIIYKKKGPKCILKNHKIVDYVTVPDRNKFF